MNMGMPVPELRISAVRLHNAGLLSGAILAPFPIGAATVGHGLADPSRHQLLGAVTVLVVGGCIALEVSVRRAYVALAAGQISWRTPGFWASRDKPVSSISRIELAPKGNVQIHFTNGDKLLELSAKEFRRGDLDQLARALSAAPGRDILR
jgi:hypothetical protein